MGRVSDTLHFLNPVKWGGKMKQLFLNMTPEQAGIPSKAVIDFVNQLEENKVNIHSFCMMRGDHIFAEGYWKPFDKEFQHRMYSVAKSFVSIAIGLLQEEGKLSIHDPICDYFKDKLPIKGVHPYIGEMTIQDMLKMTTAHRMTTYKRYTSDDWVESFFVVEPTHYPGTVFSYDTSSPHVLSALIERLSGLSLMDYLRIKVLNSIQFSEAAKFIPDPMGVSQGGSGLVCTMEDLMKLAYVCMNGGLFQGVQLIPQDYLKEATSKQVDTSFQPVIDEQQGYGYQFWQSRFGGFTMYGMGGQLAVCLPRYQVILVVTADTQGNPTGVQSIYEAFWQKIFPYVIESDLSERMKGKWSCLGENLKVYQQLEEKLKHLCLKPLEGNTQTVYSERVQGRRFLLNSNPMGIEYFQLELKVDCGVIVFKNKKDKYEIPFGIGRIVQFQLDQCTHPMLASAAWVDETTLNIQVNLIGEVFAHVKGQLSFKGQFVTVSLKRTGEALLEEYEGFASGKVTQD